MFFISFIVCGISGHSAIADAVLKALIIAAVYASALYFLFRSGSLVMRNMKNHISKLFSPSAEDSLSLAYRPASSLGEGAIGPDWGHHSRATEQVTLWEYEWHNYGWQYHEFSLAKGVVMRYHKNMGFMSLENEMDALWAVGNPLTVTARHWYIIACHIRSLRWFH